MLLIPSIDIRDGKVVRLLRGDYSVETVYADDPAAVAAAFAAAGAERIHVVDLDGARSGAPINLAAVGRVAQAASPARIELGGGLRTDEDVESALESGARWAVIGTAAVRDPELVRGLVDRFGDVIVGAVDARGGAVAVEGWTEGTDLSAVELGKSLKLLGVEECLYTDIARDGTLSGPNVAATRAFAKETGLRVIASGGVSSLADLKALAALEPDGVFASIVGRALYEGRFTLEEALQACSPNA